MDTLSVAANRPGKVPSGGKLSVRSDCVDTHVDLNNRCMHVLTCTLWCIRPHIKVALNLCQKHREKGGDLWQIIGKH